MNVLSPLRRDEKSDWANGSGPDLVVSKIKQVLATHGATETSSGELPWRMSFGSRVDRLRHQNNTAVLTELATIYIKEALAVWVPEAVLTEVKATRKGVTLLIFVRYRMNETDQPVQSVDFELQG